MSQKIFDISPNIKHLTLNFDPKDEKILENRISPESYMFHDLTTGIPALITQFFSSIFNKLPKLKSFESDFVSSKTEHILAFCNVIYKALKQKQVSLDSLHSHSYFNSF